MVKGEVDFAGGGCTIVMVMAGKSDVVKPVVVLGVHRFNLGVITVSASRKNCFISFLCRPWYS